MAIRNYANAPATKLAASCTSGATTIQVDSVNGLPISYPYTLIIDRGEATEEAVSVTNAAGTTLTVTRAIDSTTAFAHSISAPVVHGFTAQDLREPNTHVNANSGVHGVTGSVVGTTDTQTLTGKTMALGSNTVSGTKAQFDTACTDADFASLAGAETLTNKTVALGSNTVSGTKAQFDAACTDADFATLAGAESLTNKTLDNTSPSAFNPSGMVVTFAGASAPTGWLLCDGSAVSRTTYAALFTAIGTTYGSGDGATTFNLPNLKGRVPVGVDAAQGEFDLLGETGGAKTHTLTTSEMPAHNHPVSDPGHDHDFAGQTFSWGAAGAGIVKMVPNGTGNDVQAVAGTADSNDIYTIQNTDGWSDTYSAATGVTTTNTGGGAAHNNLQPYIAMNYIIKA